MKRHHIIFLVLFFALADALALLRQAICDFDRSREPEPAVPVRVQFRGDPGWPIDFERTIRI